MATHPKGRRLAFSVLIACICLCVIEGVLSVYPGRTAEHPLAIARLWHAAKVGWHGRTPRAPVGIWQYDPELGYSHVPNSSGVHREPDFEVTYTIGEHGERYIPAPERPLGRILFLGGSLTFGHGVGDNETYPHLLSRYWSDWHIVNRAAMGWGTSHAYVTLRKEIESDTPPSVAIYAMIPHHIARNYIRQSWLRLLSRYGRGQAHFELIDGAPVFQGVIGVADGKEDSPDLRRTEIELTQAFLVAMHRLCQAHRIPFVVVLLRKPPPAVIYRTLTDNRIPTFDLLTVRIDGFPHDDHPNPSDHKRIAESISKSFVGELVEGLARTQRAEAPPRTEGRP